MIRGCTRVMPYTQYSLVAALTMDGYSSARAVEGSVDGLEFSDFIVKEVVKKFIFILHKVLIISSHLG